MGLDMYLNKHTYVPEFNRPQAIEITGIPGVQADRVGGIEERIGYWRKANAIHAWFVRNVQGGVDECQETEVSREQLEDLRGTIAMILACKPLTRRSKLAASVLPPQPGFFFGGTKIDEGYWEDLRNTQKILELALAEPKGTMSRFTYRSSW